MDTKTFDSSCNNCCNLKLKIDNFENIIDELKRETYKNINSEIKKNNEIFLRTIHLLERKIMNLERKI